MAVATDPILQQAFSQSIKPLDLSTVDYDKVDKSFDTLKSDIQKANAVNFQQYKYFAGKQEALLKNLNTDLSKVRGKDRLALRQRQLDGMKMVYDNDIVNALHSQDFWNNNSQLTQDIAMSKMGQSHADLIQKQMNTSKDFNNVANREKYKAVQEMELGELQNYSFNPITPIQALDLSAERKRLFDAYAKVTQSIYDKGGIFGAESLQGIGDEEWDKVLDASLAQTDDYGVSRMAWATDAYERTHPDKEDYTEEEVVQYYKSLFPKPDDVKTFGTLKNKTYPLTYEQKLELERTKTQGRINVAESTAEAKARYKTTEPKEASKDDILRNNIIRQEQKLISKGNYTAPNNDNVQDAFQSAMRSGLFNGTKNEKGIYLSKDVKNWQVGKVNFPPSGLDDGADLVFFRNKNNKSDYFYFDKANGKSYSPETMRQAMAGAKGQGLDFSGSGGGTSAYNGNVIDYTKKAGFGYKFGKMSSVKGLVVHHTGGRGSADSVINVFKERNFPAQYIMERDGKVYRALPNGARGQHVKKGEGIGKGFSNSNLEGIEVIAKNDNDWTNAQIEAMGAFVQDHSKTYGYDPYKTVFGHGEINSHKQKTEGMSFLNKFRKAKKSTTSKKKKSSSGVNWK